MPAAQSGISIRVDRCPVGRIGVAIHPDHALQRFQCGVLPVLIDPLQEDFDDAIEIFSGKAVFFGNSFNPMGDIRPPMFFLHESGQGGACIWKQYVPNECDGTGRAFDVGNDGFDRVHAWPS